jgi:hypothetical protein
MRKFLALCFIITALAFGSVCSPANSSHGSTTTSAAVQDKGNPSVKVWVNTDSHVYHCPGTRWYGNTKKGEYMTQKEAQDKGNRAAYGRYCQ